MVSRPDLVILKLDRIGPLLAGVLKSESEEGRTHVARILLDGNTLCGCLGSLAGGRTCKHLKALLESLDKEELVQFILEATAKPQP